ncbi:MAG TPA: hypothetical protein VFR10_11230 [bacterium]|nr:hypothetical protein [bacterium]
MPLHSRSSPTSRRGAVFRAGGRIVKRFPRRTALALALAGILAPDAWAQERHSMGITAGVPQTIAFTFEAPLWRTIRVQGNLGTIFLYSSACTRLLWVDDARRWQPNLFGGFGAWYKVGTDTGDSEGGTAYGWIGGGLRYSFDNVTCFGELGAILGLNEDKGFDPNQPVFAIGLLFHHAHGNR